MNLEDKKDLDRNLERLALDIGGITSDHVELASKGLREVAVQLQIFKGHAESAAILQVITVAFVDFIGSAAVKGHEYDLLKATQDMMNNVFNSAMTLHEPQKF